MGRPPAASALDILAFAAECRCPVIGTVDITAAFDYSESGARRRLDHLEGCGLLASRVIGGTRVWWLTDDGVEYIWRFG